MIWIFLLYVLPMLSVMIWQMLAMQNKIPLTFGIDKSDFWLAIIPLLNIIMTFILWTINPLED